MPRSIAPSTTRRDASKSMRPPKLLPPSPTTDTSTGGVELPSLRFCIRNRLDLSRLRGTHDRIEHRHPVQDVLDRNRIWGPVADRACKGGERGIDHADALVVS